MRSGHNEFMPKGKPGPKKQPLDEALIERMARVGLSQTQIARALDVANHTIDHLAQKIEQWGMETQSRLRSKLIEKALSGEGDTQALIFLHRAWLGMRDNQPIIAANVNINSGAAIDSSPEIQAIKMQVSAQLEKLTQIEVERRVIEMTKSDTKPVGLIGVYEKQNTTSGE